MTEELQNPLEQAQANSLMSTLKDNGVDLQLMLSSIQTLNSIMLEVNRDISTIARILEQVTSQESHEAIDN